MIAEAFAQNYTEGGYVPARARKQLGRRSMATAVAVGQPYVQNRDIRAQRRAACQCLLCGARLAYDGDVRLGVEEVAQPPSDNLVVVEEEHFDRRLGGGSGYVGHVHRLIRTMLCMLPPELSQQEGDTHPRTGGPPMPARAGGRRPRVGLCHG